ncbi:MAG: hypothetical protein SOW21_04485 [[Actinobacillus] rossii]|nr:hypothetical protein [[Actinobacillus] rossii]
MLGTRNNGTSTASAPIQNQSANVPTQMEQPPINDFNDDIPF